MAYIASSQYARDAISAAILPEWKDDAAKRFEAIKAKDMCAALDSLDPGEFAWAFEYDLQRRCASYEPDIAKQISVLSFAEYIDVRGTDVKTDYDEMLFYALMIEYDFVAPGYTAYIPITDDDVAALYRFYEADPDDGREAFIAWRFKFKKPCNKVAKRIAVKWNLEALQRAETWV